MSECEFCELDKSLVYNTIIEETENFYIKPSLGALVEGYILIISKRHINSMQELDEKEKSEYVYLVNKYRNIFLERYNKYPIIFEHGTTPNLYNSSSSVVHAHIHIINYNYKNEENILKDLNFKRTNSEFKFKENNESYIFYINPKGEHYITYDFKPISQIMRKMVAKELNMEEYYDWRKYSFYENIIKTINKLKISEE